MSDRTPDAPPPEDRHKPAGPKHPPKLSLVQVMATVLAAVTSTTAMSTLGAAGTIYGAALASLITVVGNYLYSRSIVRTHQAVRKIAQSTTAILPHKPADQQTAEVPSDAASDHPGAPPSDTADDHASAQPSGAADDHTSAPPADDGDSGEPEKWFVRRWNTLTGRFGVLPVSLALGLGVFVLIIGVVTAVETASGRALSGLFSTKPSSTKMLPWVPAYKPPQQTHTPSFTPTPTNTTPSASPTKTQADFTGKPDPTTSQSPTREKSTSPSATTEPSDRPTRTAPATEVELPPPAVTTPAVPTPPASTPASPPPAPTVTVTATATVPPATTTAPPPTTHTPTPTPTHTTESPTPSESPSEAAVRQRIGN